MPDLRYLSQEDSLVFGIKDVHRNELLTDCFFIAEGGERIKCHQCILVCSPILKSILDSLDIRISGNSPVLSVPDFHPNSIRKLLQFLYEGEVSLQKGSRTLIEFKELCNLLEIDPSVNKFHPQDDEQSGSSQESQNNVEEQNEGVTELHEEEDDDKIEEEEVIDDDDIPSIPCEFCSLRLQDLTTYEAHVSECEIKTLDSFKMPDNFDLPEEIIRSSGGPPSYAIELEEEPDEQGSPEKSSAESKSSPLQTKSTTADTSDSEGFEDILTKSTQYDKLSSKESQGQLEKKKKTSSKFKLIDDLFGEDPMFSSSRKTIQSKKYSIIPSSSNPTKPDKKSNTSLAVCLPPTNHVKKLSSTTTVTTNQVSVQSKKEVSAKSVIAELNEKRKRTISKLKDFTPSKPRPKSHVSPLSKWVVNDASASESEVDEAQGLLDSMKGPSSERSHHSKMKRHNRKRLESLKVKHEKLRLSSSSSRDSSSDDDSLFLSRTNRVRDRLDWKGGGERSSSSNNNNHNNNSKRVKVSVQLDGKEPFIEYATYKLRLLCGSEEETDKEEGIESSSDTESSSRLRRVRRKDPSSYEETKWDKLKLKRLERSKSVHEIKSIIESKVIAKQHYKESSSGSLKRSMSEAHGSSNPLPIKRPQYDNRPIMRSTYPFKFNYGLSSENKLLGEKSKSQALLSLSKVSFKKKPILSPPSGSHSSSSLEKGDPTSTTSSTSNHPSN
uniref:BTB domain-containing protein n=1 Tax=Lepeophtheirus salmonis TaxID=72036 RepID=A0A0K2VDI0_LEPSM